MISVCSVCTFEKEHYLRSDGTVRHCCIDCYSDYQKEQRKRHINKRKDYDKKRKHTKKDGSSRRNLKVSRNYLLRKKYGITIEEYECLFLNQKGVCAICGKSETRTIQNTLASLVVDHDHKTGQIRGLLCNSCNMGLGKLGDSVVLLQKAVQYLESFNN